MWCKCQKGVLQIIFFTIHLLYVVQISEGCSANKCYQTCIILLLLYVLQIIEGCSPNKFFTILLLYVVQMIEGCSVNKCVTILLSYGANDTVLQIFVGGSMLMGKVLLAVLKCAFFLKIWLKLIQK